MALMASKDAKEIFQYHIKHGADINQIDKTLGTPLMITIRDGSDFELTKWVIEQGADVSIVTAQGAILLVNIIFSISFSFLFHYFFSGDCSHPALSSSIILVLFSFDVFRNSVA